MIARVTALLLFGCLGASGAGNLLLNGDFESGVLTPWYEDRSFGSVRPWMISTTESDFYAFCLGVQELRQDFTPILGSEIVQFSFLVGHQKPGLGNPMIEIFYVDGSSSGFQEISLDPSHADQSTIPRQRIWDEFDLLGYVDEEREVSGVSVFGIPNNVLRIDDFTLIAIPEPSSLGMAGSVLMMLLSRRSRR